MADAENYFDFNLDDAEMVENEDGTIEFVYDDIEDEFVDDSGDAFYRNLVEDCDDDCLKHIVEEVLQNLEDDLDSRSEWETTITDGLKLLGTGIDDDAGVFEGACTAHHPLLLETAVKFQSKASPELLPATGPAKARVLGDTTLEKEQKANRVQNYMNYQLTEVMKEYFPSSERMLFYVPLVGSAFKKVYFDSRLVRPKSDLVTADVFVVPYHADTIEEAERYTHIQYLSYNEMRRNMVSGLFQEYGDDEIGLASQVEFSELQQQQDALLQIKPATFDEVYTVYEQHVEMYIPDDPLADEDGLASPYIVTIEKDSERVLGIRRNWKQDDPLRQKRVWFVHYPFVPGLGFYGFGYIHLLGNLELSLTTVLRTLVDSGQFASMQGGFKLKGLRILGDNEPFAPGEWREVEATGTDLSKALMPMPKSEPSNVLFEMLSFLDAKGQKFADSTEQVIQDSTNYGPVGTTMALLEASTKFFNAIHKRFHHSQKEELRILFEINSEFLDTHYPYDVPGESREIFQKDFDGSVDVIPVSDPNISSNAHRMAKNTALYQMASQSPDQHNMTEVLRHIYTEMDIGDVDRFLPRPEEAEPLDPISDIFRVLEGKPIKAFPGQNHDAHIAAKGAWLQDPTQGKSPQLATVVPFVEANIKEHMVLKYQEQLTGVVAQAGVSPNEDPRVIEQIMAEAAQMVLQANQMAAQQGQQGDPEQIVAQAEMQKAMTADKRAEYEHLQNQMTNALKSEELLLKKAEILQSGQNVVMDNMTELEKERMKLGTDMIMNALKKENKDLKQEGQKLTKTAE